MNDYYVYTQAIPPVDYYDEEKIVQVGKGRGTAVSVRLPTGLDAVTIRIVKRNLTKEEAEALVKEMTKSG